MFLNEVILLERGPSGGRSWAAARSSATAAAGDLFVQWLAQLFFGAMFIVCFWFGTGMAVSALLTSEMTWEEPGWGDLYGVRFQVALWLAIAFFTVARFLTYIDHRIRKEGWEIELRLQDVARTARGGRGMVDPPRPGHSPRSCSRSPVRARLRGRGLSGDFSRAEPSAPVREALGQGKYPVV